VSTVFRSASKVATVVDALNPMRPWPPSAPAKKWFSCVPIGASTATCAAAGAVERADVRQPLRRDQPVPSVAEADDAAEAVEHVMAAAGG